MSVLVLGAGVSGRAAAHLLRRLGEEPLVYDRDPSALEPLGEEGFEVSGGPWRRELLQGRELVVASPGFPEHSPPIRESLESGLPVWSEVELAFRHLGAPVVAVTGTNGKTTVSELAAAMLVAGGATAVAAGNIGTALSAMVGEPWDVVVVEVSSFQLRFVDRFHPAVAVVLNVAPDHLDWHGGMERYTAAKANVFRRQRAEEPLVYDVDDEGAVGLVARAPSLLVPVSGTRLPSGGSGPDGGALVVEQDSIPLDDLPRRDPVHLVDLAAAGVAARRAGASPQAVAEVARAFRPGGHRRSVVGCWEGVAWVDDSKATNPHAAVSSASAFPSVVLVAGGRNKELDLAPLVAVPSVRHVVAIGEAAPELLAAAGERGTAAGSMEEAVAVAARLARPGDTVLLAPGCASFDMYSSYAERGDDFAAAVLRLQEANR